MQNTPRALSLWLPLLFVVLALLCFFGLNFYGLFAGREALVAHASLDMIYQWDFTLPVFDGKTSLSHMPLFHHLQAISFGLLGASAFSARVVAALAGFLLLLTLYGSAGGISGSQRYGIMVLVIAGFSLLFLACTRIATPDILAALLLYGASALLLANLYARERSDMRILVAGFLYGFAFIAGAGAALIIPAVVLLVAALMKPHQGYNLKCISPFSILFAAALALLPWVMFVVDAKGFLTLEGLWRRYTFLRIQTDIHTLWPLLLALFAGLFPWVLWLPIAAGGVMRNVFTRFTSDNPREALPLIGGLWVVVSVAVCWLCWPADTYKLVYTIPGFALLLADRFDREDAPVLGWLGLAFMVPVFVLVGWLLADLPRAWSTFAAWREVLVSFGMLWPAMPTMPAWLQDADIQRQSLWLGMAIACAGSLALLLMRLAGGRGIAALVVVMAMVLSFATFAVSKNIYHLTQPTLPHMANHLRTLYTPKADMLVQHGMKNHALSTEVGVVVPTVENLPDLFRTPARRYLVVMPEAYFAETFNRKYPGHHTVDCFDHLCVVHLSPRLR